MVECGDACYGNNDVGSAKQSDGACTDTADEKKIEPDSKHI